MAVPNRTRLPMVIALAVSVCLHVGALFMLVGVSASSELLASSASADESLTSPGIHESAAATISWIGFQDPTPHVAPEAATDQAQVSPDAGESVVVVAEAARQAVDHARDRLAPVLERGSVFAEALRDQAIVAARRLEAEQAARRAAQAREAREQAEGNRPALPDERDAAATSTEKAMVYKAGRPLARQGLQIRTVRPNFDAATRAIERPASRRNPVVLIAFARDGTVRSVSFVAGGTGLNAVDEPIKTAVYRWTATGSDLEELPSDDPDATLQVRIRFDL